MPETTATGDRTPVQKGALVVALLFLVVGIAGFIPGVTTHFGDLSFAGRSSQAELLGIFQVSVLHNLVHLLFAVLGFIAYKTARASGIYLIGGGGLYLVLTFYGAGVDLAKSANFVPFNTADNWLHLALSIAMIGLGVLLTAISPRPEDTTAGRQQRPLSAGGPA